MIAICVGHSRLGDSGAESVAGVSEWDYNEGVAHKTAEILAQHGIDATVYDDYRNYTYSAAMVWLARQLRADDVDRLTRFTILDTEAVNRITGRTVT